MTGTNTDIKKGRKYRMEKRAYIDKNKGRQAHTSTQTKSLMYTS
jgi:hypothetical protein